MQDLKRDIAYIRKNLIDKPKLEPNEMDKLVLYDMYMRNNNCTEVNNNTTIQNELNDVFPALRIYELEKEQYKKTKNKDKLIECTRTMLKEIIDFLQEFHKNCDVQEERDLFHKAFGIINDIK